MPTKTFAHACKKCGAVRQLSKQELLTSTGLCKKCSLAKRKAGLYKYGKGFGEGFTKILNPKRVKK